MINHSGGNMIIKSQRLAGFLMQKGFKLHRLEPCTTDETKNVFIFTMSGELDRAINEYKQSKTQIERKHKTNDSNKANQRYYQSSGYSSMETR